MVSISNTNHQFEAFWSFSLPVLEMYEHNVKPFGREGRNIDLKFQRLINRSNLEMFNTKTWLFHHFHGDFKIDFDVLSLPFTALEFRVI